MFKIPLDELNQKAYRIRRELIELLYKVGSGHLDTSLSLVEIWLSVVYSDFFALDPDNGAWDKRDRIFLSEGHACPLQYLINADLGYYEVDEVFEGLRQPFTPFGGHTIRNLEYGLENSNGSLGIGLWQAYGHALETSQKVFCIAGDGEFQEPISVSLFSASHNLKPLGNFILLINNNHLAQDSEVDIGPIDRIADAYKWHTQQIDGHDFDELDKALHQAVENTEQPSLIICNTIKGYGGDPVRADKLGSHGVPPKTEQDYRAYLNGLEASQRAD